ncbi:hypothetical protein LMG28614_03200 [Paraburkholderia ultramafica]|uniref:Lysozyme inhibitor LprI N-terminal domain-containing protein n=2 Tax=Paraburkholderia ultramafica TaxID=1544867 RepID=A0A6S7BH20_9BURK|nr:hypothetical protein LMG28614_03200 [Paraburkholderia ultramafica]
MRYLRTIFFSLILFAIYPVCSAFSADIPAYLVGAWQVKSVHVNTGVGRTFAYQWDDPRLVGRIFRFENNAISDDAYQFDDKCESVNVESLDISFSDLLRRSLGGYVGQENDPVNDYKLPMDGKGKYSAMTFRCKDGLWQGDLGNSLDHGIKGAWAVSMGNDLYLRWRDETILLLKRIDEHAKVNTSFDCSKATVSAEHTICGSYERGALDISIHDAYMRLIRQIRDGGGNASDISKGQRNWVAQRNACGVQSKCLGSVMRSRLEWLGDQLEE